MKKHAYSHAFLFAVSAAIFVAVMGAYLYSFYLIRSAASTVADNRKEETSRRLAVARKNEVKSMYETAADSWGKLPGYFVPKDRVVEFIEAIEGLGKQSGAEVSLSSIDADPMDGAVAGTIGSVKARIEAKGSWSAVMRALEASESLPYPIAIDGVSLSAVGDSRNGRIWALSFNLETKEIAQ